MKKLKPQPTLVDQVYDAILSGISEGKFGAGRRIKQEGIAEILGVSRQPVQQALLLLKNDGLLSEAPGRGLMVPALEAEVVRNVYEVRAALDKLATMRAAERGKVVAKEEGQSFIEAGMVAVSNGSIAEMVAADMNFHFFIYGLSGNPIITDTGRAQWNFLRLIMGQVLLKGETPREIWEQHSEILAAVIRGNVERAGQLAEGHIEQASSTLSARLK